jgi:hypothetical protein
MTPNPKRASVSLRRAIANLLRLADTDLQDARMLMKSGSLRNAALLEWSAVSRMTKATIAPERGWPDDTTEAEIGDLDDSNPVKARLKALEVGTYRERGLLPDGRLPKAPDENALRYNIDRAVELLTYLSEHFEVDFESEEPAGAALPVRPIPPLEISASSVSQAEPRTKPALRKPPRHRKPSNAAPDTTDRIVIRKRSKAPTAPSSTPNPVLEPSPSGSHVSSTVFWSLMDRWGVADLDALTLLGHTGGLTQKGTRPRFKLTGAENEMMAQLQDIDGALSALGLDPHKWLREPIAGAPFSGADPIAFIMQHQVLGARDLRHYIFQQGLRLSLQQR